MSQGQRRLAAIMFTDVVGYTSFTERNEASALQLLEEHRQLLRPFFTQHNGVEVKTTGDGFLVEFASALEAVNCAYQIQESLHELNEERPLDQRILIRIGIHLGDVVHSQNDVYGDAVNIASRIEPLAEPGGICVTSQVYEQVRNKFDMPMTTLGRRVLKNLSEPTEVYAVVLPWSTAPTALTEETPTASSAHRVAVLPFTNMSPDPSDEYFADGMTEEVISTLSQIEGIEVISRTSVMQYKKSPKPIPEVAKELDVGTVLEGSIRKAGNRLRVTVQMVDATKDRHVWAESYDRDLQDVFTIQSDIAKRVADALQTRILKNVAKSAEQSGNVEAYTMYLRAMQLYHQSTESSLREAYILFKHVIARDPGFAKAYAGLADTICATAASGYVDFQMVDKAEVAAIKALELGPEDADAHAAMAGVHAFLDRFDECLKEAQLAIQLNPNLSHAYEELAIVYSTMAELDQAREAARKASELDPLSYRPRYVLGWAEMMSGRQDEALAVFNALLELNPKNPRTYVTLCDFYMIKGDFATAEKMLGEGAKLSPIDPAVILDKALLYAYTGRMSEAQGELQEILKNGSESVRLNGSLFVNCALGNLDEAFKPLMRMTETHSWPYLINVSPVFRQLRADPRYGEFLRKVGLPPDLGKRQGFR